MIYKHQNFRNGTIIINGFKENNPSYVMTITAIPEKKYYTLHGFVSKERMLKKDLLDLYKYMQHYLNTYVVIIEALTKHANIYKKYLPVMWSKKSKTYSGYESEKLTIDLGKQL